MYSLYLITNTLSDGEYISWSDVWRLTRGPVEPSPALPPTLSAAPWGNRSPLKTHKTKTLLKSYLFIMVSCQNCMGAHFCQWRKKGENSALIKKKAQFVTVMRYTVKSKWGNPWKQQHCLHSEVSELWRLLWLNSDFLSRNPDCVSCHFDFNNFDFRNLDFLTCNFNFSSHNFDFLSSHFDYLCHNSDVAWTFLLSYSLFSGQDGFPTNWHGLKWNQQ